MKTRSIKQQILYAINCHISYGQSKRAYKKDHSGATDGKIFSIDRANALRDTAKSFSQFVKNNYPDIRMIKDIPPEAAQEYINAHINGWSNATACEVVSRLHMIAQQINNTFHCSVVLDATAPKKDTARNIRTAALSAEDIEKLRADLKGRRTMGACALEIGSRCGLRAKEIEHLKGNRINLDRWVIKIREGGKNGKYRDIPIRPKDRDYFSRLKETTPPGAYITQGVKRDSLNHAIRESMKRCDISDKYIKSAIHAIRKFYARERYREEIAAGRDRRHAWQIVQKELGHGSGFRKALFDVYIGG